MPVHPQSAPPFEHPEANTKTVHSVEEGDTTDAFSNTLPSVTPAPFVIAPTTEVVHPGPADAAGALTATDPSYEIAIDPVLLVDERSQTPHANSATLQEEDALDEDHRGAGVNRPRLSLAQKAVRYGLVDGVMRGNVEYRIVHQNAKWKPITDASSATTRYNREMPLIISRAERLALETDVYILVLAQQATGSSASIHFCSEQLRREAFDQSSNIVNDFQALMTQLVIAKRSTTLALTQTLAASEKARAEVEEQLAEREMAAVNTEAELATSKRANQCLISELEALRAAIASHSQ